MGEAWEKAASWERSDWIGERTWDFLGFDRDRVAVATKHLPARRGKSQGRDWPTWRAQGSSGSDTSRDRRVPHRPRTRSTRPGAETRHWSSATASIGPLSLDSEFWALIVTLASDIDPGQCLTEHSLLRPPDRMIRAIGNRANRHHGQPDRPHSSFGDDQASC